MGIIQDTPKYPVIDRAPSLATTGASVRPPRRVNTLALLPRSPSAPSRRGGDRTRARASSRARDEPNPRRP